MPPRRQRRQIRLADTRIGNTRTKYNMLILRVNCRAIPKLFPLRGTCSLTRHRHQPANRQQHACRTILIP